MPLLEHTKELLSKLESQGIQPSPEDEDEGGGASEEWEDAGSGDDEEDVEMS